MISSKAIVEKAFTVREPSYTKRTTKMTINAEKEINNLLSRTDIESTANPKNENDILVLFVHGFAASKFVWLDPDVGNLGWVKDYIHDPLPKDYGWHAIPPPPFFIVDWTLSNQILPIGNTELLDKENIEWLTYSQKSAFGRIETSVEEFSQIIEAIKQVYGKRRIIIIAHSRGGLISKKYLADVGKTNIEKLITYGTPFGGTFLSGLDTFRSPSKYFLSSIKTVRKLWDVNKERKIESISTKQMTPNSEFLIDLQKKGCRKDVKYINVAGSCSIITNVYTWRWELSSLKRLRYYATEKNIERQNLIKNNRPISEWYNLPGNPKLHVYHWRLVPQKLIQIFPKIGMHEILLGDGAVSVESALLQDPKVKQYLIHRNHIDMTCCPEGYDIMMREIKASINGTQKKLSKNH